MHDCAGARHARGEVVYSNEISGRIIMTCMIVLARGEVVYSNEISRILPLRKSG